LPALAGNVELDVYMANVSPRNSPRLQYNRNVTSFVFLNITIVTDAYAHTNRIILSWWQVKHSVSFSGSMACVVARCWSTCCCGPSVAATLLLYRPSLWWTDFVRNKYCTYFAFPVFFAIFVYSHSPCSFGKQYKKSCYLAI